MLDGINFLSTFKVSGEKSNRVKTCVIKDIEFGSHIEAMKFLNISRNALHKLLRLT